MIQMNLSGGASDKEPVCQCRRHKRRGFYPWVRKIPWRRKWQPTPALLLGRPHGQRSLAGYSPWGSQRVRHDWSDFSSVPFSHSCPTLWRPHGPCSMPGFPVHHQLPELAQTHFHRVSDAIQPSHPLSSPSSPTFNLSQHQGLFKWISSSHQVTKVLEFQLQHQSFQWTLRTDLL